MQTLRRQTFVSPCNCSNNGFSPGGPHSQPHKHIRTDFSDNYYPVDLPDHGVSTLNGLIHDSNGRDVGEALSRVLLYQTQLDQCCISFSLDILGAGISRVHISKSRQKYHYISKSKDFIMSTVIRLHVNHTYRHPTGVRTGGSPGAGDRPGSGHRSG
ncbi:predicted protein [Plenodomus lingam JN3]|uniref:Predicted protein n=1 Tax=Leptosphaeria maculans (strain JN3 / isolate v23.1.3 / race Av1-4-5-6-7-8) TaxID=985895 RepID=E4ZVW9_LEPMJ|nr:predicted protein [Plenodomus lingam JN3]CBX95745.1 predicted protein [Plenodomus lingam JN3]